ncbi:hypothetical protein [Bacteroides sp.]
MAIMFQVIAFCFAVWVYFPASGIRHVASGGALASVGTNAYYWSSSSYGSSNQWGAFLALSSTLAYPLYFANCGHGFPVRCVQAFI